MSSRLPEEDAGARVLRDHLVATRVDGRIVAAAATSPTIPVGGHLVGEHEPAQFQALAIGLILRTDCLAFALFSRVMASEAKVVATGGIDGVGERGCDGWLPQLGPISDRCWQSR
jgi:hypothetical protein